MSHKQKPSRDKIIPEFIHQLLLGLFIEINHDIAAKYDIERVLKLKWLHKIKLAKLNATF